MLTMLMPAGVLMLTGDIDDVDDADAYRWCSISSRVDWMRNVRRRWTCT